MFSHLFWACLPLGPLSGANFSDRPSGTPSLSCAASSNRTWVCRVRRLPRGPRRVNFAASRWSENKLFSCRIRTTRAGHAFLSRPAPRWRRKRTAFPKG
ncbi:hypothetical protein TNCV_3919061 [Trichonephila clavipes]|nr:hypothetical protein TNCV_3919061 [Trichonephila clavipes]